MKRSIFVLIYLIVTVTFASAQSPSIASGVNWLLTTQNTDRSWGNATSLASQFASTVETLEALRQTGTSGAPFEGGLAWLTAQTIDSTTYASGRLLLRLKSGLDASDDLSILLALRNSTDDLWGLDGDYTADVLDTALAVHTLNAARYLDSTVINRGLLFLTTAQNSDGGWGVYPGDGSNVYMTAVISATLQQFPQFSNIATAVNRASAFLVTQQNGDGGFGSAASTAYETALAYSALVAVSTDTTVLGNSIQYLTSTQSSNGSWNDDPYSTALALKALYYSENKPAPPPQPPAGGTITGTVIDATTKAKLTGIAVSLQNDPLLKTTTDSSGYFALANVPAGGQTFSFSRSGYASNSASTTVSLGAVANLGNVLLVSGYSTGTIAGTITDHSGRALAEV